MKKIVFADLKEFCRQALLAEGVQEQSAETVVDSLALTDAFGMHSHGTKNLFDYLRKADAGALDKNALPAVEKETPAVALVDGHNTFGMVSSTFAMELAIEKARNLGIGAVCVHNSEHFGAAGGYVLKAAEAGLIGLAMSNVDANMTIPGARGMVIGNNPVAYAIPTARHDPIFLDIALSTIASLKVIQARKDGRSVPEGWITDGRGYPTTDPSHYPDEGAMLPMAGHKGYGLALLVETMTSILSNSPFMTDVHSWLFNMDEPNRVSHTFVCVNPAMFSDIDGFKARMDEAIDRIHSTPRADYCERLYYPGEIEWGHYHKAMEGGLELPDDVVTSLEKLAAKTGISVPWMNK